jgi:hypothetical protein
VWDELGCVWDAIADWGGCAFSGDTCHVPGRVIVSFMSTGLGLPPPRGIVAVLVLDGRCGNGHGTVVRSAVVVRILKNGDHSSS